MLVVFYITDPEGLSKLTSLFKKKDGIVKTLEKKPSMGKDSVFVKTLEKNPSIDKAIEDPRFIKTFESVSKDNNLVNAVEKSSELGKLKMVLSKNPSGLTETNVKKLGSIVAKYSNKRANDGALIASGLGLLLLLISGGVAYAVTQ